jgi:hypothetical protein
VTAGTTGTTWVSGNPGIATVDSNGLATGVAAGTAAISCLNHGKTASVTLTVTPPVAERVVVSPAAATLPVGEPLALDVTVTLSNGTTSDASSAASGTVYVSSNLEDVVVTADGVVQGLLAGTTATITVLVAGQTQSCVITVVPPVLDAIAFSGAAPMLTTGAMTTLVVDGTLTDGTMGVVTTAQGLTFTTADPTVATVDAMGTLTGVGPGTTVVYAYAAGLVAQENVTVKTACTSSAPTARWRFCALPRRPHQSSPRWSGACQSACPGWSDRQMPRARVPPSAAAGQYVAAVRLRPPPGLNRLPAIRMGRCGESGFPLA